MPKLNLNYMFTIVIFRGISVRVHWSFVAAGVFLQFSGLIDRRDFLSVPAFLALIVFHELGHIYVAHSLGVKALLVKIYPFGGVFYFLPVESKIRNLLVLFGGVSFQLVLALSTLALAIGLKQRGIALPRATDGLVLTWVPVNFVLALVNLLPIKPLDGYSIRQVLRNEPLARVQY